MKLPLNFSALCTDIYKFLLHRRIQLTPFYQKMKETMIKATRSRHTGPFPDLLAGQGNHQTKGHNSLKSLGCHKDAQRLVVTLDRESTLRIATVVYFNSESLKM